MVILLCDLKRYIVFLTARCDVGFWSRVHNSFVRMTGIPGLCDISDSHRDGCHDGYLRHPNEYFLLNQLHRCRFYNGIASFLVALLFRILVKCIYLKLALY